VRLVPRDSLVRSGPWDRLEDPDRWDHQVPPEVPEFPEPSVQPEAVARPVRRDPPDLPEPSVFRVA